MPQLWRINVNQTFQGEEIMNVFHVLDQNDASTPELICDEFLDAWNIHLKTRMDQAWSFVSCTYVPPNITGVSAVEYVPTGAPIVGAGLANPIANQVAALVSWVAGNTRPNRGRTYLTGFDETLIAPNGTLTGPAAADIADWADELINGLAALDPGIQLVVYGLDPLNPPNKTYNPVTSYIVREVPGTQRRRRLSA